MRVIIAGASGFLGSHLGRDLVSRRHEVIRLVRRSPESADEARWDPYAGEIDSALIASADAVVNLAGVSIAGNPHSRKHAEQVMSSRVVTTAVLARAIVRAQSSGHAPALIAGNGISFYGDHAGEVLTETSESHGDALLTRVTRAWQAAAEPVAAAGGRLCVLRTAPVMDASSAPLKPLAALARAGLATRLGSGAQYFPMISLQDWVGAVSFLIGSQDLSGAFNLCSPTTPTNAEFTDALAEAVGRRARLAVPAPLIRMGAGAMGPELLNSVNARPAALERAGFDFAHDNVREILRATLG